MSRPIELLIPASSLEVLKTAVIFGADAVYIGGEAFGLRAKAKNFSMEDMKEGIAFAHEHDVKVYVTANILADVLVPLTPVIVNQMKKGAYYITSGILDVKEEVVVKAVKDAGLQLVEVTHQGEWVSVTARKETKA